MQKKLLILFMTMNCMAIHASEGGENSTPDYSSYEKEREFAFNTAFIRALCGDVKAVDMELENAKKANGIEEKEDRAKEYDGVVGYLGSEPTEKSNAGRIFAALKVRKDTKDTINFEFAAQVNEYISKFNKEILPTFAENVATRKNFLAVYCYSALEECRDILKCYDDKYDLTEKVFTNPDFGAKNETVLYTCLAKFASEKGIPLTSAEVKKIVEHNTQTKEYFEGMQDSIRKMVALREEIINPTKKEDTTELRTALDIDIKNDQNDQGALSQ